MNFNIIFVLILFFASSVFANSSSCLGALESKYTAHLIKVASRGDVVEVQNALNFLNDMDYINDALIIASSEDHQNIVRMLIKEGANLSSINRALAEASLEGNYEIVYSRIKAGGDVPWWYSYNRD